MIKMKKILYIPRKIISIALSIAPKMIMLDSLFIILTSVISIFTIQITSKFFDGAAEAVQSQTLSGVINVFLIFVVLSFAAEFVTFAIDFLIEKRFNNSLDEKLHKKIAKISAIRFEDAKFNENLNLAMQGVFSVEYYLFNIIGLVIKDLPYLVFLGIYLFSLRDILFIAPIIIFIPIVITQLLNTIEKRKLNEETIYLRRKLGHYENILSGDSFVKETRILGTFQHFFKLHTNLLTVINRKNWKSNVRSQMFNLASKILNLFGFYGVLWLLFDSLMNKLLSVNSRRYSPTYKRCIPLSKIWLSTE